MTQKQSISNGQFGLRLCLLKHFVVLLLAALVIGCGGGGGSESATTQDGRLTGNLVNPVVAGVTYSSKSASGVTDSDGSFRYAPGEVIAFSVGGIEIGRADARPSVDISTLLPDQFVYSEFSKFLEAIDSQKLDPVIVVNDRTAQALNVFQHRLPELRAEQATTVLNNAGQSLYTSGVLTANSTAAVRVRGGMPITDIPSVMSDGLKWNMAAGFMRRWFEAPRNQPGEKIWTYHKVGLNIVAGMDPEVQDQIIFWKDQADQNIALTPAAGDNLIDVLKDYSPNGLPILKHGGKFRFIGGELENYGSGPASKDKLRMKYVAEEGFGRPHSSFNEMLAAFGSFSLRLIADGRVDVFGGVGRITVERVGIYLADSYDFEPDVWWKELSGLGCWQRNSPFITLLAPSEPYHICATNKDFRAYNTDVLGGKAGDGDYRIFSDPSDYIYDTQQIFAYSLSNERIIDQPVAPVFSSEVLFAPSARGVRTSWGSASGRVTHYELFRSTSSGSNGNIVFSGSGATFEDTGVAAGIRYYYSVRACNAYACARGPQGVYIFESSEPVAAPGNFTLTNTAPVWDTQSPAGPAVQLSWGASSNAVSYEVFRNGSKIYPPSGTFTGTAFYNSTGMTAGQTYSYYIVAKNSAGVTKQSNTIDVGPMPSEPVAQIPPRPTQLTPGNTTSPGPVQPSFIVQLDWEDKSGATYYEVGVRDVVSGALVVDRQASSSVFTVSLQGGRSYVWNVAACNARGCSEYATARYFRTP